MNWFQNSMSFKSLLHQGLSEPEFYGDLVYKFENIIGRTDFTDEFRIIIRHKHIGYNLNVMRQSACLVINQITVGNFAALGGSGVRLYNCPDLKLIILVRWDRSFFVWCLVHWGSTDYHRLRCCLAVQWSTTVTKHVGSVESSSLLLHSIKMWLTCLPWWVIDELEGYHANRTTN